MSNPLDLDSQICPRHPIELTYKGDYRSSVLFDEENHIFTCPECGNVYLSILIESGDREWRIGKDVVATVKDGMLTMVGDEVTKQIAEATALPASLIDRTNAHRAATAAMQRKVTEQRIEDKRSRNEDES